MNINPKINNPVQGLQLHSEQTSPNPHPVEEYGRREKRIASVLLTIHGELWLHGRHAEKIGYSWPMVRDLARVERELMRVLLRITEATFAQIESATKTERARHE